MIKQGRVTVPTDIDVIDDTIDIIPVSYTHLKMPSSCKANRILPI